MVNVTASENHNGEEGVSQNQYAACNLAISGFEWVELIVSEMSNASNMDDARARASRVLEGLEKLIVARASTEATESFLKVRYVPVLEYGTISYCPIGYNLSTFGCKIRKTRC